MIVSGRRLSRISANYAGVKGGSCLGGGAEARHLEREKKRRHAWHLIGNENESGKISRSHRVSSLAASSYLCPFPSVRELSLEMSPKEGGERGGRSGTERDRGVGKIWRCSRGRMQEVVKRISEGGA